VVDIKENELNPDLEFDSQNNGRRQIIDTDPTSIIVIAKIHLQELADPKEGEILFHSEM
jgi:hypothetical protein